MKILLRGWLHIDIDFLLSSNKKGRELQLLPARILHENFIFILMRKVKGKKRENSKQVGWKIKWKKFYRNKKCVCIRTSQRDVERALFQFVI